ncbi:MAG: biotin-dependent carboxyltransferase family protein [Rhodospirillales bacterium]|nr:MAG: biotin-dependent carboxyltransferase family protein [Rhodospirillales bacterium]
MNLRIRSQGLLTTVQDGGRLGFLDQGMPPSGALDRESLALANALVGNDPGQAVLEIIGFGPSLEVEAESARIAMAGNLRAVLDGKPLACWRSHRLVRGQVLELGAVQETRTAYLAVAGGFALPAVMGSRSTYLRAGLGTRLEAGGLLPLVLPMAPETGELHLPHPPRLAGKLLRVIAGPEADRFTPGSLSQFFETVWRVSQESDRMGIRLDGAKLNHLQAADIAPVGLVQGCIQVPGDGRPILLLADHQTTGGYARIATVISADLPAAGRLAPGSDIHFSRVTWQEARAALVENRRALTDLLQRIRPLEGLDQEALMAANLVSGAVSALEEEDEP